MNINWNSKIIRRSTAIVLFLAAAIVFIPGIFKTQSFNAIINSNFIAIYAPIEGRIENFELIPGDPVESNEIFVTINNKRINESFLKELIVEKNSLTERVSAFSRHISELEKLKIELEKRQEKLHSFEKDRVTSQLNQAIAELQAIKYILNERKTTASRLGPLAKDGYVKNSEYENAKFSVLEYENRVIAQENEINRIKVEQSALENYVYLGQGRNDVPYTQQRLDEIIMNISDYQTRKQEQKRRIAEINDQILLEEERLRLNRKVDLSSPIKGVLWKKFYVNGGEVQIGSEIAQFLDCSRLFVDAEINESSLEKIKIGQEIKYRLYGSGKWNTGTLTRKYGNGNNLFDRTLAAQLRVSKDSARVIIEINPDDLSSLRGDLCHVGRKAEIIMSRQWTQSFLLSRLIGIFQ